MERNGRGKEGEGAEGRRQEEKGEQRPGLARLEGLGKGFVLSSM